MGSMLIVSVVCLQPKYFGSVADFLNSHFSTQLLQAVTALTPGPSCYILRVVKISPYLSSSRVRQEEEDSAPPHHLAEMGMILTPAMMHNTPQLQCPALHWGVVGRGPLEKA